MANNNFPNLSKLTIKNNFSTLLLLTIFILLFFHNSTTAQWLTHGGDINNRRNGVGGSINPASVRSGLLTLKWKFLTGFDVTATPSVADGAVYFPSWNGNLYAVNASNGALIWQRNLGQLTGILPNNVTSNVTVSRATPVVAGDILIVGIYGPAYVVAVTRATGRLVWTSTRLDFNRLSIITLSGTVYKGGYYGGVSSVENLLPVAKCCTFRGSMFKLDVRSGRLVWQTYTLPDNGGQLGGYAGAAIWGSSPSIDARRGHVYVGTGNLYTAPDEVLRCQARRNNGSRENCIPAGIHLDSLMAFDVDDGRIVWARRFEAYDVFNAVCLNPNSTDCPPGPNLDADFGEAPMLLTIYSGGRWRDVAVAVQKSGFAWAVDRDNGNIVWFTKAGPGSILGGGTWGAATDGARVYTNIVNGDRLPFQLKPSNRTTTAGGWVGMDANTGKILWTTANPSNETANGPVTVVNGVVFAGSVATTGPVYGMDARTGAIIWSFHTGATVYGGASASYGCIYIGHGYTVSPTASLYGWNAGKYVFALCIS